MINFKLGDRVKVVDDNTEGSVIGFQAEKVEIENEWGFSETYFAHELLPLVNWMKEPEKASYAHKPVSDLTPQPKKRKREGTFEIDLHFTQLPNYDVHLSAHRILQRQLVAAKQAYDQAKVSGFAKICFVHGKGKGSLEQNLIEWWESEQLTYYDADFKRYKLGATEVEIKE